MVELQDDREDRAEGAGGGEGIDFQQRDAQVERRIGSDAQDRIAYQGAANGQKRDTPSPAGSKVPLDARVVKFPIMTVSRAASELTRYPDFAFTDEEAGVLADAIAALGMEVTPVMNVVLLGVGMVGGKVVGYAAWKRNGERSTERRPDRDPSSGKYRKQGTPNEPDVPTPPDGEVGEPTLPLELEIDHTEDA